MTKTEHDNLYIESLIYFMRGQNVMLDADLARLYDVETRVINQAVKRNLRRFPEDFMFKLTNDEYINLRSQNVISSLYGGRRHTPFVFTENGVAMLSSVLKSETAIEVNIAIMRTFTKLRSFLAMEESLSKRIDKVESDSAKLFKIIFSKLDTIEFQLTPRLPANRKKIGL